jgi:signal transduction histidine kinase
VTIDATQEEEYSAPANAKVPSLCVTVTDSGVGIPAEEIPLLFERYRQISTSKTAKQKGTGLGLSICKLIVEAHGGSIRVESEVGKYSKFRFTIPIGSSSVTNASAQ